MKPAATFVTALWRQRLPLLGAAVLLALLLGQNLRHLGVDNAIDIWFLQDDPALLDYREFQRRFGQDEVIVIAVRDTTDLRGREADPRLRELRDLVGGIDGIARVDSALDYDSAAIEDPAGAFAARRWISDDGRVAILLANVDPAVDIDHERENILGSLRERLDEIEADYHLAGFGVVYAALNRAATDDSTLVTLSAYGLILLLLVLLYRKAWPLLMIIATASLGALAVMGAYAASGQDLNMVTMIIPTLILVASVSTSVHLLLGIAREPAELSARERVLRGIGSMFWPCLINVATTAAGFLSLTGSPMPVISSLGLFAAFGLVFSFALALCLALACSAGLGTLAASAPLAMIRRFARGLTGIAIRFPRAVGFGALCLGLLALAGLRDLQVDTYSIEFLFEDHVVRQDSAAIERDLGAYMTLDFTVETPDPVLRADLLARVAQWQADVVDAEYAQWSHSPASVHQALVAERPELAGPVGSVRAYLPVEMLHGERAMRVSFGVPMMSAREIAFTIDSIAALAELPADARLDAAGYLPLYARMMAYIVETQVRSFAFAFALVMLVLALLFRSARQLALIALSNLLPVLLLLGAMGWLGIRLDVATVTIAAIVFGLVVDDSVHFLYRLRAERRHGDLRTALLRTAGSAGHAMTITTLVMVAGFAVLMLAAIKSIVFFGLLVALAMIAALLTDLLLLPALLSLRGNHERD
ncbi:MAG: MMPL family transporter [Gammaproteobacteria bacterium]|nr:MMPL family transporter [Gammaproteobacteria bacterium]